MMRNLIIILFAINYTITLSAQPLDQGSSEANLSSANGLYESKDYYNALKKYEFYYKTNKDLEVAYKIASINEQLRDYEQAEFWYAQSSQGPSKPITRFKYGQMLKMNGKYEEAKAAFQMFLKEATEEARMEQAIREIAGCELALSNMEVENLNINNLGAKINSKYSEYSPILVSEDEMYFTAIRANKIIVKENAKDDFYSKAYVAQKDNGKWGAPKLLSSNINEKGYHIGNLCLSEDGNTIYFTQVLLVNSIPVESKLYFSKKSNDRWGEAQLATGLNGRYLVRQPAVGEMYGQKVIFFTAKIDSKNHSDIYYSTIRGNTFSPPQNLGAIINSEGDEEAPFFKDGTLYFSSNGHVGIGGFDIFSSQWNGANWSEPKNMGKGYNSSVDDLYFSLSKSGDSGFLVSNRPGTESIHGNTCCNDIYEFNNKPKEVEIIAKTYVGEKIIKGASITVIKKENKAPVVDVKPLNGATVKLINASSVNKNELTSSVSFLTNQEDVYLVIAQKGGYNSDTLTIKTSEFPDSKMVELELFLTRAEPKYEILTINEPIELENIFFDFDKSEITRSSEESLVFLLDLMNDYPDMVIEISSHTDSRGEAAYNLDLSQKRAESVKDWLIKQKINERRIKALGHGESKIRNKCLDGVDCEEEEHRINRRTEFRIIEGPTNIQVEKRMLKSKN